MSTDILVNRIGGGDRRARVKSSGIDPVSYTHLTLPTNREV